MCSTKNYSNHSHHFINKNGTPSTSKNYDNTLIRYCQSKLLMHVACPFVGKKKQTGLWGLYINNLFY